MVVFTRKVDLVWQLDFADNYQFDRTGDCYNVRTGRKLKRTMVGYTVGYCIGGKFMSLSKIRNSLIKIERTECPF